MQSMFSIPFQVSDHESFYIDNPFISYIFLQHIINISSKNTSDFTPKARNQTT